MLSAGGVREPYGDSNLNAEILHGSWGLYIAALIEIIESS